MKYFALVTRGSSPGSGVAGREEKSEWQQGYFKAKHYGLYFFSVVNNYLIPSIKFACSNH